MRKINGEITQEVLGRIDMKKILLVDDGMANLKGLQMCLPRFRNSYQRTGRLSQRYPRSTNAP